MALALLAACNPADSHDPGLLQEPEFGDDRVERPWVFSEHAGGHSYTIEVTGGVAVIRRTGDEPWARLMQSVPADRLSLIAGRRAEFSVQFRAALDGTQWGTPFEPTGLGVKIWTGGKTDARSRHLGAGSATATVRERLALDPSARIEDWQRHALTFDVPENAERMEVAVIMSTGGRLEIRRPALRVVD